MAEQQTRLHTAICQMVLNSSKLIISSERLTHDAQDEFPMTEISAIAVEEKNSKRVWKTTMLPKISSIRMGLLCGKFLKQRGNVSVVSSEAEIFDFTVR
jgi:hypothetical protein